MFFYIFFVVFRYFHFPFIAPVFHLSLFRCFPSFASHRFRSFFLFFIRCFPLFAPHCSFSCLFYLYFSLCSFTVTTVLVCICLFHCLPLLSRHCPWICRHPKPPQDPATPGWRAGECRTWPRWLRRSRNFWRDCFSSGCIMLAALQHYSSLGSGTVVFSPLLGPPLAIILVLVVVYSLWYNRTRLSILLNDSVKFSPFTSFSKLDNIQVTF